ncbi:hypothetical protein [Alkalicoccus luteus]|uniref:Uncharacterized protein n=1 Tax=Alkalicoccus luteus TaxID=1237094 RepID=A0A969PMA3_9BACI|nr:hypothetical protein [Alkalicoccus luteus]NJP36806.1 hypothetical protein [Alkalicoccus luteus]
MQWLYLFTGVVASVIAIYHLFTDRLRRLRGAETTFTPDDTKKISTHSTIYKISVYSCYLVLILSIVLFVEVFNSFQNATILFVFIFALGLFILLTLDRVFEIQGDALIFAGYHARWSTVQKICWGRQKSSRRQLIMELAKGQKIKTTIANEAKEDVEETLAIYCHFETDKERAQAGKSTGR